MSDTLCTALRQRAMDTRGEAPPEARSCGERPSDESGEESGEETAEQPERATTFTLNGEVWTFENPVSK